MLWKREAIADLRRYSAQKQSLQNTKERIRALEQQYTSVRSNSAASTPVKGGGNRMEDALLDNIVLRDKLTQTRAVVSRILKLVERGLKSLDERDQIILHRFYIVPERCAANRLAGELGVEVRQVYNLREQALYRFTLNQYGISEI